MITFEGNRQTLKSAKLLESRARNTYPHISTSKIRKHIGYEIEDPVFFKKLKEKYTNMRKMIRMSNERYSPVIYGLSDSKLGNCTEDAKLVELLGKINGQKNIYTGGIGLKSSNLNLRYMNHVVAFITEKPVKTGEDFFCKNKEAIIIDPWLGVTDFAENYFTKLKSIFRKVFLQEKNTEFETFIDDHFVTEHIKNYAKTLSDFKIQRSKLLPKTELGIIPLSDNSVNTENIDVLREFFPELTIKNYKAINLSTGK